MKTKYFLLLTAVTLVLSSCQKDFDPTTYAPALNINGYTSSKQIAPSSLIAYWAFDGSLIDSVSNTAGTNTGTSFSTGIKGKSLQGALNGYVTSNTPAAVQNLKSFTLTCWFNMPLNDKGIVGLVDVAKSSDFWGNLTLFMENNGDASTGRLVARSYTGVVNNGGDNFLKIVDPWNKWNQIAYSYDATTSTYKVYFNGSKIGEKVVANLGQLTFQDASKMVFGTVQFQTTPSLTNSTGKQDWASYLVGQLDEVKIFNKALTDVEIGSLSKLEGRGK
ncbi:LamG domain-containing protein [Pedobacter sp. ISL-68]|uniref:LamG-like jellyroll fold domain-containing protein n=1 Tax=unclassified Pedobacter TaxID=2628915 RepID=UPI001BE5810F|nr:MULTISPECIES: LamG-like jellyroll fold domain-containing protein [unclassified Pedobacter]MBT2563469.1 LamG domain-containing protein [Pedobacter sp. ISL-64]MBT2592911.1 LamG domain-containing protein [Pedobacter sp. ISL-68]